VEANLDYLSFASSAILSASIPALVLFRKLRKLSLFFTDPINIDNRLSVPALSLTWLNLTIRNPEALEMSHWDRLTFLELNTHSIKGVLVVLQKLVRIKELNLYIRGIDADEEVNVPPKTALITLKKLRMICVAADPMHCCWLFEALEVPALEYLTLSDTWESKPRKDTCLFGRALIQMLSSPISESTLRTLIIDGTAISEETLLSCLAICRSISEFSVIVGELYVNQEVDVVLKTALKDMCSSKFLWCDTNTGLGLCPKCSFTDRKVPLPQVMTGLASRCTDLRSRSESDLSASAIQRLGSQRRRQTTGLKLYVGILFCLHVMTGQDSQCDCDRDGVGSGRKRTTGLYPLSENFSACKSRLAKTVSVGANRIASEAVGSKPLVSASFVGMTLWPHAMTGQDSQCGCDQDCVGSGRNGLLSFVGLLLCPHVMTGQDSQYDSHQD